jgi:hypothetical protein
MAAAAAAGGTSCRLNAVKRVGRVIFYPMKPNLFKVIKHLVQNSLEHNESAL